MSVTTGGNGWCRGKSHDNTRQDSKCDGEMPLRVKIRHSLAAIFQTLFSPLTVFIWLASIIVATIASPFGTSVIAEWPMRAVYWLVIVSVSVVIGYAIRAVSIALVGIRRPVLLDVVMIVLILLVITPVIWGFTRIARFIPETDLMPLSVVAGYVILCASVIVVGRRVMPGFEGPPVDIVRETATEPIVQPSRAHPPRILRRLEPGMHGQILRLTANDHFVEIATVNGIASLRMRLTDAIAEMEPVIGYCVHRSHWVAHDAIVRVERQNTQKLYVVLANGEQIPVSRKYRVNLERAGLI